MGLGPDSQLQPAMEPELREHTVHVRLDGMRRDTELKGDCLVAHSAFHAFGHLTLAARQGLDFRGPGCKALIARPVPANLGEERRGERRWQYAFTGYHLADGGEQILC